jgi:hypothetical protein
MDDMESIFRGAESKGVPLSLRGFAPLREKKRRIAAIALVG